MANKKEEIEQIPMDRERELIKSSQKNIIKGIKEEEK